MSNSGGMTIVGVTAEYVGMMIVGVIIETEGTAVVGCAVVVKKEVSNTTFRDGVTVTTDGRYREISTFVIAVVVVGGGVER